MNQIKKFLAKLDAEKRSKIILVLGKIVSGELSGLDIKKLKGGDNYFRVRKGNIRIFFIRTDKNIEVIKIDKRDENTYNSL
jgi:mRNA-degrading endonuclease RelE of RelBE toxin-antitoxin system